MDQHRGRYQIIEAIASGGQATVYLAQDGQLGRQVALKVLHPHLATNPQYVERFLREARMAASINHPNVVIIHDVGREGDLHYIAMEYLPSSLDQLLEQQGQLPVAETISLASQIASGVQAAHEEGITHRDLKPQNVLLTNDGRPKVSDFGIARAAELTSMTSSGVVMGTPYYMSPEQGSGDPIDARSDVYSLGCLIYQMLTGELPFYGTSHYRIIRQHIEEEPRPLRDLRRDVPQRLVEVVERAMAKEPPRRFQSMSELAAALQGAIVDADQPLPATTASPAREDATVLVAKSDPPAEPATDVREPVPKSGLTGKMWLVAVPIVATIAVVTAASLLPWKPWPPPPPPPPTSVSTAQPPTPTAVPPESPPTDVQTGGGGPLKNDLEANSQPTPTPSAAPLQHSPKQLSLVETIIVPVDGSITVSETVLDTGVQYQIRASGTFNIGGPGDGLADAEYYDFSNPSLSVKKTCPPSFPPVDIGIAINDSTVDEVRTPDWGPYNPSHSYDASFIGMGAPISLNYHDCRYGDNRGSLRVEIFEVAPETTLTPVPPPTSTPTVDPPGPRGCTPISMGDPISDSIGPSSLDTDCYSFVGTASDRVIFRIGLPARGPYIQPVMEVRNSGSAPLQTWIFEGNRGDGCSGSTTYSSFLQFECELRESGHYTVFVSDVGGDSTGSYDLWIQSFRNPAGCALVGFDEPATGKVGLSVELGCHTFSGTAGSQVRFRVASSSITPSIGVRNPDGTPSCHVSTSQPGIGLPGNTLCPDGRPACHGAALQIECDLTVTGTHTVFVSVSRNGQTGSYEIALTCLSQPCP